MNDLDYSKIEKGVSEFHKVSALIFWLVLATVLYFTVLYPVLKLGLLYYLPIILAVILYWLCIRFHLPRFRSKGKVGVILSIYSENEKDLQQIKNDVITKVKKEIISGGLSDSIGILEVPNHQSKCIITSNDIAKAHSKVGGHLFIQGVVKKRSNEGEKNYIELEGRVIHTPIDLVTSSQLSKEFRKSLPPEIVDDPNFQIRQIKLTSDTISESSVYIIGIAALISGDPMTAIKFHDQLLRALSGKESLNENEQYLKDKTINNLAYEYMLIATHHLLSGDQKSYLEYYNKARQYNPDEYSVLLVAAIDNFKKSDIVGAKLDISKAKDSALGRQDWRYSDAFLHYWSEEFGEAYESSKKIFLHDDPWKVRTSSQVIAFNEQLLKKENNKPQLKFWIGYLYLKCLDNTPMAHKYFSEFIHEATEEKFKPLTEKAKGFLSETEKEMGVEN